MKNKSLFIMLIVLILLLSINLTSDAPQKYTSIEHGFTFTPPAKYVPIPIPPEYRLPFEEDDEGEKDEDEEKGTSAGKEDGDGEKDEKNKKKKRKPELLEVAIFEHKIPDPEYYTRSIKIYRITHTKTLEEACKFFEEDAKKSKLEIEKVEKCIVNGVEGKRYHILRKTAWGATWFRIATVLSKDERSFAIVVSSGEKYGRRHIKDFALYKEFCW